MELPQLGVCAQEQMVSQVQFSLGVELKWCWIHSTKRQKLEVRQFRDSTKSEQ